MDAAVAEDPAGHLDVAARRRRGVEGGRTNRVDPAELARLHGGPRGGEGGVEAPRVADLHLDPAVVHVPGGGDGLREIARQRLLAEDRDPGIDPGAEQLGMGVGRRGDDDRVDTAAHEALRGVGHLRADPVGDGSGRGGEGIGDDQGLDGGKPGQGVGVERADPAESDQAKAHVVSSMSGWAHLIVAAGSLGWVGPNPSKSPQGRLLGQYAWMRGGMLKGVTTSTLAGTEVGAPLRSRWARMS